MSATIPPHNESISSPNNSLSPPPSPRSPSAPQTVAYPVSHLQNDHAITTVAPPKRKRRTKKEIEADRQMINDSSNASNSQKPPKVKKPRSTLSSTATNKKLVFPPEPQNPAKVPVPLHNSAPSHQNSAVTQLGNHDAIHKHQTPWPYGSSLPPRPDSGQNYDPIRSATIEPRNVPIQHSQQPPLNPRVSASTPPRAPSHASISPSIASLLEPHNPPSGAPIYNTQVKRENEHFSQTSPPDAKRPRLTPPTYRPEAPPPGSGPHLTAPAPPPSVNTPSKTMEVESDRPPNPKPSTNPNPKNPSGPSSSNHSPKPAGRKEHPIPPPLPGNGLLSSGIFGGSKDSQTPARSAPTIILNVPLNGETNKIVNFARLAEEQYGFEALHPRLAAQRERLARVAAAGAALENANKTAGSGRSADEMSVDLSDGEPDADNSNVEMGGVDGVGAVKPSGEGGEVPAVKKRRKRTMKEDMYDKDDAFIDDSEMAFEEQAAAAKDGFFVYSGLLVPLGEKAVVE
ncbi:MAG: hypothetical protein Q9183_005021, partial [Haloplaca sp. 2 TL-2023]